MPRHQVMRRCNQGIWGGGRSADSKPTWVPVSRIASPMEAFSPRSVMIWNSIFGAAGVELDVAEFVEQEQVEGPSGPRSGRVAGCRRLRPPMLALPANPEPAGYLGHWHPAQHRLIPLRRHADLNERPAHHLTRHKPGHDRQQGVSHISRSERRASTGTASHVYRDHVFGTASRIRPPSTALNRTWSSPARSRMTRVCAGQAALTGTSKRWGGWGSNPRPADYESAALTG